MTVLSAERVDGKRRGQGCLYGPMLGPLDDRAAIRYGWLSSRSRSLGKALRMVSAATVQPPDSAASRSVPTHNSESSQRQLKLTVIMNGLAASVVFSTLAACSKLVEPGTAARSYLINARSKIRAQASCTMPR